MLFLCKTNPFDKIAMRKAEGSLSSIISHSKPFQFFSSHLSFGITFTILITLLICTLISSVLSLKLWSPKPEALLQMQSPMGRLLSEYFHYFAKVIQALCRYGGGQEVFFQDSDFSWKCSIGPHQCTQKGCPGTI